MLASRLRITHVGCQEFPPAQRMPDTVVVSSRLILVLSGRLRYTVEGTRKWLETGDQLLVPAWSRRSWTTPRSVSGKGGASGCSLLWCEFWTDASLPPPAFYGRKPSSDRIRQEDEAALKQIFADWTALAGEGDEGCRFRIHLRMEGYLKRCLGCFWADAIIPAAADSASPHAIALHPEVAGAIAWLEAHFADPGALEDFYARKLRLSPNHFRILFRKQTGETVQQMLARLRLRQARYLVHQTMLPLKVVAAESGFSDPLYFSQCYHRFWKTSPSADRQTIALA